jgi:hypothetical protein
MDFRLLSHFFASVKVPVLWGSRAVLQDPEGHLSIIDIEGDSPILEVLDDQPGPGAKFLPSPDGYVMLDGKGRELYSVNPKTKSLTPLSLRLPPLTLGMQELRVGSTVLDGKMAVGIGVGAVVTESTVSLGGALPPALAAFLV